MTRIYAAATIAVTISLASPSTQASVINADGHALTSGLHPGAVLDTITNLLWLDATETANRSFNEVLAALDPAEEFDGWRVATRQEIHDLYQHAGLTITNSFIVSAPLKAAVSTFDSIYGFTDTSPILVGTEVFYDASFSDIKLQGTLYLTTDNRTWVGDESFNPVLVTPDSHFPQLATALVRAAPVEGSSEVPETASIVTWGLLALAGALLRFGTARRPTKNNQFRAVAPAHAR